MQEMMYPYERDVSMIDIWTCLLHCLNIFIGIVKVTTEQHYLSLT